MEHPHGTHINAERIGINLSIKHNVTIGVNKGKRPTIGNNVGFGPGAKVLGKVTIGDNCFVAANAVVVKDMPANSLIGGVPAKVIKIYE